MKNLLVLTGVLLSLSGGGALAQSVEKSSAPAAYAVVRDAPRFAVGGVGFAAILSEEEKALGTLVERKDAAATLEGLLKDRRATVSGRLYALLGLKHLAAGEPKAFAERLRAHFAAYRSRGEEVEVMSGCVVFREPVSAVAKKIESGDLRLSARVLPGGQQKKAGAEPR